MVRIVRSAIEQMEKAMLVQNVTLILRDEGRVSRRTKGSISGLLNENAPPPFIYFPW